MALTVLANWMTKPNWASPSQPTPPGCLIKADPSFSSPNPKFSETKKQQFLQPLLLLNIEEPPGEGLTPLSASDDASSINQRPNNNNNIHNHNYNYISGDFNLGGYVTFNVSTRTKKELIELNNHLASPLDWIRQLKDQIKSSNLHHDYKKPNKKSNIHNLVKNKRPFPSSVLLAFCTMAIFCLCNT